MAKKKVTNTQKTENHPEWHAPDTATGRITEENKELILSQQMDGQKQLCAGNVLPIESLSDWPEYEKDGVTIKVPGLGRTKAALEALGVVFGERVKDDPLFQYAELPTGWSIKPMEHMHWNMLTNDKGKNIIKVFYCAAFNDRRAHMLY